MLPLSPWLSINLGRVWLGFRMGMIGLATALDPKDGDTLRLSLSGSAMQGQSRQADLGVQRKPLYDRVPGFEG